MTGDTELHDSDQMALIDLLCGRLSTQFENTSHGIIQSTSIANFKLWPEKEEALDGFGDKMIKKIVDQFGYYLENCGDVQRLNGPY